MLHVKRIIAKTCSGINNVTFDTGHVQNVGGMRKFIEKNCQLQNRILLLTRDNKDSLCFESFDTFTSATQDFDVALDHSQMSSNGCNVVFDINISGLWDNPEMIYGDIKWLSRYNDKQEVLVAPSMLWIYEIDKDKWPDSDNGEFGAQTKAFGVELRTLENVLLLMKRLPQKLMNWVPLGPTTLTITNLSCDTTVAVLVEEKMRKENRSLVLRTIMNGKSPTNAAKRNGFVCIKGSNNNEYDYHVFDTGIERNGVFVTCLNLTFQKILYDRHYVLSEYLYFMDNQLKH